MWSPYHPFERFHINRHIVASTHDQALSAILFLYQEVLKQQIEYLDDVLRAKKAKKLPVVLIRKEIDAMLNRVSGTMGVKANQLYGFGLLLIECIRCRVKDRESVLIVPGDQEHFTGSDDKRRLLYVALSRATKSLALVLPRSSPSPLFRA